MKSVRVKHETVLTLLKKLPFLVGVFCLSVLTSVASMVSDTIELHEVKVVRTRESLFRAGQQAMFLDRSMLRQQASATMDELLADYLPAGILSYGSDGSLATLRLRGGGSNHTQVSWNGISLNSPTTGITDFSLIPAGLADQLVLVQGASGSLSGNSTFGGALFLSSEAEWDSRMNLRMVSETGSFGTRRILFTARGGSRVVQADIRILRQQALNDFRFHDVYKPGAPLITQSHDGYHYTALVQNLYFQLPGNQELSFGTWYQTRDKEIPAIMGSYVPGATSQQDSSLRMYLNWKKRFVHAQLSVNGALNHEYLRYTDPDGGTSGEGLESFYRIRQSTLGAEYRLYLQESLVIDAGLRTEHRMADVEAYGGSVRETLWQAYSGIRWDRGPLTSHFSLRKPFITGYAVPWMVSLSTRLEIFPGKLWSALQAGNRFRVPSLNERFWVPGGNPAIHPETGWGFEWMNDWYLFGGEHTPDAWLARTSLFSSLIDHWIQWVPGISYWNPVNYKQVWSRGLEIRTEGRWKMGDWSGKATLSYQYIRATNERAAGDDEILGRQLPYIPSQAAAMNISMDLRSFGFRFIQHWTGKRYTTADNQPAFALEAYFNTDLSGEYRIELDDWSLQFGARIANLFNQEYQAVRSYALPGRAVFFSLSVEWNRPLTRNATP